ncbi:MAG TPA: hypothetical protein VNI02_10770 [Blastocatellia bacterium]|jgi:hypothetical protein|nr:hypothetical protein [Blastocatellia bacterium]
MTASWKYVKRLIAVALGLLGLVSWLALQTPALPLASTSSRVKPDSFKFAGESYDRGAIDVTDPAFSSKARKVCGNLPLMFEATHGQADSHVKFISRGGAYNFARPLAGSNGIADCAFGHTECGTAQRG